MNPNSSRRQTRRATVSLLAAGTLAALVGASIAFAAAPPGKVIQAGKGKVIQVGKYASFKGPWYVWNKTSCSFHTTATHPKTYISRLRQTPGLRLVYTPEATGDQFDDLLNSVTKQAAVRAGIKFFQFSNAYPSTTAPLQVVDEAHAVKADVAISGNVLPDQYPRIQQKYHQYCIPFINEYNEAGTKNVPAFQNNTYKEGALLAQTAAKIMRQRGWPASQIWIVSCADPTVAATPGTQYDILRGYRQTLAKLLTIPSGHVATPDLNCTFSAGTDGARAVMADWLTAHPAAKYVTAVAWIDDVYGIGLGNALRNAGFGNRALVVSVGDGAVTIKLIAKGDPIVAVDIDRLFPTWGPLTVSMAQDVAQGVPVPALASPKVVVVTKANAKAHGG